MKNTMKKMLAGGAVACGLMMAGLVGAPSADACGGYGNPQEFAQMRVESAEADVEHASAKLDEAVRSERSEDIERYAREVTEARARLKTAKLRLKRFEVKRVAKRDIKRVNVSR